VSRLVKDINIAATLGREQGKIDLRFLTSAATRTVINRSQAMGRKEARAVGSSARRKGLN
jgi:hypothetical protein